MRALRAAAVTALVTYFLFPLPACAYMTEEQERAKFNLSDLIYSFSEKVYELGNSYVTSLELQVRLIFQTS